MNGAENMVTRDRENADMFNGIFALDLSSKIWLWHSQVPETYGKVRHDLPLEQVNQSSKHANWTYLSALDLMEQIHEC